MLQTRCPPPPLRPFLEILWTTEGRTSVPVLRRRERVLPTGAMHLVVRLTGGPFRFFDDESDPRGRTLGWSVVGGARAGPYLKEVAESATSVGVVLAPGACEALFGTPADELSGRHAALDDLWSWHETDELRQRLLEAGFAEGRLAALESLLAARLPPQRGIHPAVAHALERLGATSSVSEVVRETGYSHRHFVALFRRSVGLAPKLYCRVLRFRRALHRLAADPAAPQVEVALESGYSDQAHFAREFRDLAGITPGHHRALAPTWPEHVSAQRP